MKKIIRFFFILTLAILLVGCKKTSYSLTIPKTGYLVKPGEEFKIDVDFKGELICESTNKEIVEIVDLEKLTFKALKEGEASLKFSIVGSDIWPVAVSVNVMKGITVNFDFNGGKGEKDKLTLLKGEILREPEAIPTRPGFKFKYWSSEQDGKKPYKFEKPIHYDTKLYAIWEDVRATVAFDVNGGAGSYDTVKVIKGEKFTKPLVSPVKNNYVFKYWGVKANNGGDITEYDFNKGVEKDLTLYAVYEENPKVIVSFDLQGGLGTFYSLYVYTGNKAIKPTNVPKKHGFIFEYWSAEVNGSQYDFQSVVSQNITFYAVYRTASLCSVNFDLQGGTGTFNTQAIYESETITKPDSAPVKLGHKFKYWSKDIDGTEYDFKKPVHENLTLHAVYQKLKEYIVTFDLDGGTGDFPQVTIYEGNKLSVPETEPLKPGNIFKHWRDENGGIYNFDSIVTKNITLFAVFRKAENKKVTFDLQGGTGTFDPVTLLERTKLAKPSVDPEKTGFTFKYWSQEVNGYEYDFDSLVNEDMTLFAVWERIVYRVTFLTYEGELIDEVNIENIQSLVSVENVDYGNLLDNTDDRLFPVSRSHNFKHWSTTEGGAKFDVNHEQIFENLTLHAVWEAKTFEVSFSTKFSDFEIPTQIVKYGKEAKDPRNSGAITHKGRRVKMLSLTSDGNSGNYEFTNKVTSNLIIYVLWKRMIKQISAGGSHSLALTEDGEVYSFGANSFGQLGLGDGGYSYHDEYDRTTPTLIDSFFFNNKKIKQVSAGSSSSFALTEDGEVYAWGRNYYGQLGLGDGKDRYIPTKLDSTKFDNRKVSQISAGGSHSLALTEDGEVYSFGYNYDGELGLGDMNNRDIPTKLDSSHYGNKKIIQIAAGSFHSLILTEDGFVYSFGGQYRYVLGLGNEYVNATIPHKIDDLYYHNKRVERISAGGAHSFIVTVDKKVYAFGENSYGQLGLNDTIDRPVPIQIATTSITKINRVVAGSNHSLILTYDGKIYSFGAYTRGELGLGDHSQSPFNNYIPNEINAKHFNYDHIIQVSAGRLHTLALTKNDNIYVFGRNSNGQLGINNGNESEYEPVMIDEKYFK